MIPPLATSDHLGLLASVSLKSPQPKPAISQKCGDTPMPINFHSDPSDILGDSNPSISWNDWCKAFLNYPANEEENAFFRISKKSPSLAPEYKRLRNAVISETPKRSSLVLSSSHVSTFGWLSIVLMEAQVPFEQ